MQPKYKIGDEVYYMKDNAITKSVVTGIFFKKEEFDHALYSMPTIVSPATFLYFFSEKLDTYIHKWVREDCIFPTKEELISLL